MKCSRYNKDAVVDKSRCQHYLNLHAVQMKRQRQRRIENKICILCGKVPPIHSQKRASVYYKVLCYNCNSARHINGGICPHQNTNT